MNRKYDLIIRGGTVVDGTGSAAFQADVGIVEGCIAQIGEITGGAKEEIDAKGLVVTPGFVDIHTHYDGQAMWDSRFGPSSWHGVTTVVMGNCGVGFAPCKAQDRDRLIELMEGVEDIPGVALHEGLDWRWETFGDYLDALERKPHDIDFCAQLPHAALRVYVMGKRASRLEMATEEDCRQMRALAAEAMRAGAIGFSTSRSINHKSIKGLPTPTLKAAEAELAAIACGLKDAGAGVLQMITDFDDDIDAEFGLMRRLAETSGRPLSFSLMQKHGNPDGWRRALALTAQAAADGVEMRAQVAPRGVGVLLGLQGSRNVFSECPSYQAIASLPFTDRVCALNRPELRDALLREICGPAQTPLGERLKEFQNIFDFGNPPNYDPGTGHSIASIAARAGREPGEVAYELLLAEDGCRMLYSPFANYADATLAACGEMIADPNAVIGLGDGGAHVALVADSSFPTFLLTYWGQHIGGFELPWLVKRLTADTARAVGLSDRGAIAPGLKADLNIIDPSTLSVRAPHMQFDLPAGGRRLMQRASGYVATIVSGQVIYRNGQATGALPGRLIRGTREAQPS